jgi:hypothetical protein
MLGGFFRPEGRNREFVDALFHTTGALLTGRRTCDLANGWGAARLADELIRPRQVLLPRSR